MTEKFEEDSKISSTGDELVVPSIFTSGDYKRHMSINLNTGLWQCFKSGNQGNFIQLYAFIEGISYNQAEANILFKELQGDFGDAPLPFAKKLEVQATAPARREIEENLKLVPVTVEDYECSDPLVQKAWSFLYERKLFNLNEDLDYTPKFYVSKAGQFRNRLIISFEEDSEIFYFQARSLGDESPKYLNPTGDWPKPSSILFPYDTEADSLVVCEGPLDAITLQLQGVNATCTMGCSISEHQVEQLKEFEGKIIIGYDNDEAGHRGVNRFDYLRRVKRMADLYICHPPSEVKDWNDAHIQGSNLKSYVAMRTKKYDYDYLVDHLLTTL